MYILTVWTEETRDGVRFSATLYDRADNGAVEAIAVHGPLLRTEGHAPEGDLQALLQRLERYVSLLEYGVSVDGTLAEPLF